MSRIRATIVRSFTDRGTGKKYRADTIRLIDAGHFGNYQAAGLAEVAPPRLPRKSSSRASAPAPTA